MQLIFDNIIFSFQRAGGVSVYWFELLRRILRDKHQFAAIERKGVEQNIFRRQLQLPPERILADRQLPVRLLRYLPPTVRVSGGAIFHSSYYRVPVGKRCTNIMTVYDFIYERYRSRLPRFVHSLQKKFAINNADGIICISESTKRDLMDYLPSVDERKIKVIHLGFGDDFRRLLHVDDVPYVGLQGKTFFIFVGSRKSYKNFSVAVKAIAGFSDYALVVVGGGPLSKDEKQLLDTRLTRRYFALDGVSNKQLNVLYNRARALIYPSSYEGFGIPIIEAMAAGCPVIATNASSIPEACGDAGLMVDQPTPEAFAMEVSRLENDGFRESVITKGLIHAASFSWETCYQKTIALYSEIDHARHGG